jgi:hypothetical protein
MFDAILGAKQPSLVVSATDIDAAIEHLKSMPEAVLNKMPTAWGKEQFLIWLKEELPTKIAVGDCIQVSTGVYAHIVPVGHGYLNAPDDHRHLVILSVRSWHTDLDQLTDI